MECLVYGSNTDCRVQLLHFSVDSRRAWVVSAEEGGSTDGYPLGGHLVSFPAKNIDYAEVGHAECIHNDY